MSVACLHIPVCWHEKRQSTIQHTSGSKVASISAEVSLESAYSGSIWILEGVGYWKILPAHLTQQISLLVRSYEIRNVIRVLGSWDVLLSKVHLWYCRFGRDSGRRSDRD
jgi:hypothetical protein